MSNDQTKKHNDRILDLMRGASTESADGVTTDPNNPGNGPAAVTQGDSRDEALRIAELRGKRDGLIAAKSVVIEHGWNPYLGAMCADIDARLATLAADLRRAGEGA